MPTYQYRCTECGNEFEEFQAINDPPIVVCPLCKGKTTRIITGGAGLIFKGSGFYITDYKRKEYKKEAAKESKDSSKPSKNKTSSEGKSSSSKSPPDSSS